jgi:drug/metabolite transporter (DMT)-like permease
MSWLALGLLVLSAFFHMGWNLLMKQASDGHLVAWWALAVGGIAFLPLSLADWHELQPILGYAVISAFFQLLYYLILGYAYNRGDFSLVYPIARGAAPLFIALGSILFLGERLPWTGILGLLIVVTGISLIGLGVLQGSSLSTLRAGSALVAPLAIALTIAAYSVLDGAIVQQTDPLAYTVLNFGLSSLLMAPLIYRQYGWQRILTVGRSDWWRIGLISLGTYAAYSLVLVASKIAPISYVGAVRGLSIVFAALTGWLWLGEPFGLMRTMGAIIVVLGILTMTLAG